MNIKYYISSPEEIEKVSEQIMISYVSAYKGLMDCEYLSSRNADHWIPILQESAENGDICLVAESDGKVIGSAVFCVVNHVEGIYAEWHAFYLLPEYTGLGIGHSFFQKIEEEMIARGCTYCILEVLSSNERAIKFYISHGFIKTDTFEVEEFGMRLLCDKMKKTFIKPGFS